MNKIQELFFFGIGVWLTLICTDYPAITYHLALAASIAFWTGAYVGSPPTRSRLP